MTARGNAGSGEAEIGKSVQTRFGPKALIDTSVPEWDGPAPAPMTDGTADDIVPTQTTVSALMPTFERTVYLREAIESALAQKHTDLVLLIGDNSESDAVEELVRTYDDPRIRYRRNPPGMGPQENWLDLVRRAETPLVATLHDDDVWEPDFLSEVVPVMEDDPSIEMVFTDYWIIDSTSGIDVAKTNKESRRNHRDQIAPGPVGYDLEQGLRLVAAWNAPQPAYAAVLRTETVRSCSFPDEIAPLYDIWLSYQVVRRGGGLYYEPQRLTRYRVHDLSLTSGSRGRAEDAVFERIIEENKDLSVAKEISEYWADLRWGRATRMMCQQGARRESQSELGAASANLDGLRKLAARVGSRSNTFWEAMRLYKLGKHAILPK